MLAGTNAKSDLEGGNKGQGEFTLNVLNVAGDLAIG